MTSSNKVHGLWMSDCGAVCSDGGSMPWAKPFVLSTQVLELQPVRITSNEVIAHVEQIGHRHPLWYVKKISVESGKYLELLCSQETVRPPAHAQTRGGGLSRPRWQQHWLTGEPIQPDAARKGYSLWQRWQLQHWWWLGKPRPSWSCFKTTQDNWWKQKQNNRAFLCLWKGKIAVKA